jgi:hypothetical protein
MVKRMMFDSGRRCFQEAVNLGKDVERRLFFSAICFIFFCRMICICRNLIFGYTPDLIVEGGEFLRGGEKDHSRVSSLSSELNQVYSCSERLLDARLTQIVLILIHCSDFMFDGVGEKR